MSDIEDDGFITIYPSKETQFKTVQKTLRGDLSGFDEVYHYKGFALINELYEDEDCRKNCYQFGQVLDGFVVDITALEGLSSRSYASFEEAWSVFTWTVENILKKMQNKG
jgi:hypothetical protein